MRLNLRLSPNTEPVPFDHLHQLTGALHKWLGENDVHEGLSLYSFGWLGGGKRVGEGFSSLEVRVVRLLSLRRARTGSGSASARIRPCSPGCASMRSASRSRQIRSSRPLLVDGAVLTRRNRDDGGRDHLTFRDAAADEMLTRTLRRRLEAAGFKGDHLDATVRFDRSFEKARTKLVTIKGTQYRTSECPVIIEGTPEAVQAAWLLGVGELTGMGLGALK